MPAAERPALAAFLEDAAERVQGHFARSGFAVEIHQCFLDLVTIDTATLGGVRREAQHPGALW